MTKRSAANGAPWMVNAAQRNTPVQETRSPLAAVAVRHGQTGLLGGTLRDEVERGASVEEGDQGHTRHQNTKLE